MPVDDELFALGYDPPERALQVGRRCEALPRGAEAGEPGGDGANDEPALSFAQAARAIRDMSEKHGSLAWAVVSMGQFQAYLQAHKVKA
jgi:hypothetical protein